MQEKAQRNNQKVKVKVCDGNSKAAIKSSSRNHRRGGRCMKIATILKSNHFLTETNLTEESHHFLFMTQKY